MAALLQEAAGRGRPATIARTKVARIVEATTQTRPRGAFPSVPELIAAMQEFIATNNDTPKPFVWTAGVEKILQKIGR